MKDALIITTTGSPSRIEKKEIKNFLKNFLSDKNLVKIPRVLLFLILSFRPYIIKKKYEKILVNGESPLNFYLKEIKEKLQREIKKIKIETGNLYSKPFFEEKINSLKEMGFKKFYVLPLYPHKSSATTEVIRAKFEEIIFKEKIEGKLFPPYFNHPDYIKSISEKILEKKEKFDFLIFSYHSLPLKMKGSLEYKEDCLKTTELILNELNFNKNYSSTTFQGKFGFGKWLQPSTKKYLKKLAKKRMNNTGILCPSFPVDCLETLYDIKIVLRQYYKKISGKDLIYIEALNSSNSHINFLKKFIEENL